MGPDAEIGALERCRFLWIRFGRWRIQLTEGGALRWLFDRTSASLQGRVRHGRQALKVPLYFIKTSFLVA